MTTETPHPAPAPDAPPLGGNTAGGSTAGGGAAGGMDGRQWARLVIVLGLLVALTAFTGVWGLIMVLGIVGIIFLHELGHFVMAKRAGMKVTEFFIGFGPRIWSFRRGETAYGIKAIPAGAYVKIIGMNNLDEVPLEDEGRTYRQKGFWPRFGVAVAGSTVHFILALVLIFVVLVGFGAPNGELVGDPDDQPWVIGAVTSDSAAAEAGLRAGDRLLTIDGLEVGGFERVREIIGGLAGDEVAVTLERDGERLTRDVTIGTTRREGRTVGFLGVGPDYPIERLGVVEAVPRTFDQFGAVTVETFKGMGRIFSPSGIASFGDQVVNARSDSTADRDVPESSGGSSSGSGGEATADGNEERLSSLVGVFQIGVQLGDASGISALLVLFVLINIFIGILNLAPMLPFDGGHVVLAIYEKIQERRKNLQTRYFADVGKLLPVVYLVVILLAGLFVSTLYVDLANPISIN